MFKQSMQIGNFDFSVIELHFEPVDKDYKFFGSYYRGILGRYLKRRFCILRNKECENCPLNNKCLYILSFEKYKDVLFPPYVINRCKKDMIRLTLTGSFSEFSEMYLESFARQLKINEAGFINPLTYAMKKQKILINSNDFSKIDFRDGNLILDIRFVRLKKDSKMITCDYLDINDILKAIEKRIYLINKFYGDSNYKVFIPDFKGDAEKIDCKYDVIQRYSNRQKRLMKIPSINCKFRLTGSIKPIFPYLFLSRLLNIGTNSSMGFGQIELCDYIS